MRDYEAYFIVTPRISDENREALLAKIEKKVKDGGAQNVETQKLGLKKLPFKFNNYPDLKDGYSFITRFSALPSIIAGLNELFRISEDVVRFQVTIAVPKAQPVEAKEEKVEISASMLEGGSAGGQS